MVFTWYVAVNGVEQEAPSKREAYAMALGILDWRPYSSVFVIGREADGRVVVTYNGLLLNEMEVV